ncbi:MAG TPA: hypothetical protein VE999_20660 [Gemmataceae bacterium]|nr:hypothetical protein [Gemmataceae bacterium]
MHQPISPNGGELPRWLVLVGSAAILYHLAAITLPILDMKSGPWPGGLAEAPAFAHSLRDISTVHGRYLRIAHSYEFPSNRPSDLPGVEFEVRLKDAKGNVIQTLHFPDPHANLWVRQRQDLLARNLAPDQPLEPPRAEILAAPGQKLPTVSFWALPNELGPNAGNPPVSSFPENTPLHLQTMEYNNVPRYRQLMRPTDLALVLERSYARYLCRKYNAASAEVLRHTREPVSPAVLFGGEMPPHALEDLVASFGEVSP